MPIKRLSQSGLLNFEKHSNLLAGNAPVSFGAFDLLETVELTAENQLVSFTGLDTLAADYKHLQIRCTVGANESNTSLSNIYFRFNNTSGTYANHILEGKGSSVTSSAFTADSLLRLHNVKGRDSVNGIYGAAIIDILDFASTTKNKTVRSLIGAYNSGEQIISLNSGLWVDTSAITSIDQISSDQGAGSRFSLYGIKGA